MPEAGLAVGRDAFAHLKLSVRARNYVRRLRLRSVNELVEAASNGLPKLSGYGRRTYAEILAAVGALSRSAPKDSIPRQIGLFDLPGQESLHGSAAERNAPFQAHFLRQHGELGLPVRAVNALQEHGVHLVGDLVGLSEAKLLRLAGLGRKTVGDITRALAEVGLELGMRVEGWPPDDVLECRAKHASVLAAIRAKSFMQLLPRSAASHHMLEDEFEAIGGLAGSKRNRTIVLQYLGFGFPTLPTLEQVGLEHGLTRERVRQLVAQVVHDLRLRVLRPPRLLEATRLIRQNLPISSDDARLLLEAARLSRGSVTAETIARTLSVLTNRPPILQSCQVGATSLLVDSHSSKWLRRLAGEARRRIARRGVARVSELTSWLATACGRPVKDDVIRTAIEGVSGAVWLDDSRDWFTILSLPRNRLLNIVRKVLSVSGEIEVRALREGIQRQFHMKGFAPPSRILERFVDALPWCHRVGQTVTWDSAVPRSDALESRTEQVLVRVLRQHGPVMSGYRLVEESVLEGVGEDAANSALCYSPILQRVAFGVYALRGQTLDPGAVAGVIQAESAQGQRLIDFGWSRNRTLWLATRLSRSIIRTGIFGIPAGLRRQLKDSYDCRLNAESTQECLRCNGSQAWGLKRLLVAAGAKQDQIILLEFDNRVGVVDLSFGRDEVMWARLPDKGAQT